MRRVLPALICMAFSLVFAAGAQARTGLAYTAGNNSFSVYLANVSGQHAHRLGHGAEPQISPNGAMVAASLFGTKGAALVIYRPGAKTRYYFNLHKVSAVPLAWSPDSRYLAVQLLGTSTTGKGSGLGIIDTAHNSAKTVATGSVCGASFAPGSSDRLAYGRAPGQFACFGRHVNVYTIAGDGSGKTQLTHDGASGNPAWGKGEIAFDRATQRHDEAPEFQIWTMHTNGSHRKQITHTSVPPLLEGLVPLQFSSNGKRLLAAYAGEDTYQTWTIQLPSGQAHQLTIDGQSVQPDAISRNGKTVLVDFHGFESPPSHGMVESLPFGGGTAKLLVKHGDEASWNR